MNRKCACIKKESSLFPQVYIEQVCKNVESAPLNSDLQLAGLRLLTNMSVTSDYHHKMIKQIPCLLHVLSEGSERTQVMSTILLQTSYEAVLLASFLLFLLSGLDCA